MPAREILEKYNNGNRPLKKDHVKNLASSLKNNEWMLNGEAIAFSKSGDLLDGQHRLTACKSCSATGSIYRKISRDWFNFLQSTNT